MNWTIVPMNRERAAQIVRWQYPEPYEIYSMDDCDEDVLELMNGDYAAVLDTNGDVLGFYCAGHSARVAGGYGAGIYDDETFIDFGLGMKPDLTGQGGGLAFVREGMEYVNGKYPGKGLRLVVASFNERAATVYERAGFEKKSTLTSVIGGQTVSFICMTFRNEGTGRRNML